MRRTLAVVAVLLVAGCQSMGAGEPVPEETVVPEDPEPAAELLLQIDVSGGYTLLGYDFSTVPNLTVYADGRAIVHGPQTLIYPGPALPNLLVTTTDPDALITAASDAGLLGDAVDYGQPAIADTATTFVTLTVDGQTYRHAANALDIETTSDLGLSDAQMSARTTLAEFVAAIYELVGAEGEPYETTALAIMGWPVDAAAVVEPAPQVLPWPLDLALADAADCTLVTGTDAATLLETLANSSQTTQFEQGARYEVHFRPLLPHETGCADLA